jgi:hypothetical protein
MSVMASGIVVASVIGVIFIIPVAVFAYIAMSIEKWMEQKDTKWDE